MIDATINSEAETSDISLISAKLILGSENPFNGIKLYTLELKYPRYVHSELLTHRLFSRNAASSRAIPTSKMLDMVNDEPVIPIYWGKLRSGMSPDSEISEENIQKCRDIWLQTRDQCKSAAKQLYELKLHKQLVNRILEPWQYITTIVSGTNWNNFLRLREHSDAQSEIARLAECVRKCIETAVVEKRQNHLPFIQTDEFDGLPLETLRKISTARCARVSYLTHDGKRDSRKDLDLFERLITGSGFGHFSPFEHVAEATDMTCDYFNFARKEWQNMPIWCGNFQGWIQFRKMFETECQW